ncbi:hypothetical protein DMB99_17045 [Proteus mirabilis]|uniref:hypothetical protein n=1 Tax=Proteus mirabilis TaxID=584 RepID=UPI000D725F05|nr:hypothetical protein [Proteus mirabilis]EKW2646120.1 hypothetical protein [Proteus mirabilis]ELA7721642.1 hypothetical protein [Proteus mirabilis]ELA9909252.1 hypothetical protein [Proteus mirabilis]MDC9764278.1 hypothetical protein [Proteus mirabilis]PXA24122.1 hypothetical protein DMB99_17045 [Proteus mirabilis]
MLAYTQLTLVRSKLREISESPYFSNDLHLYLVQLRKVVDKLCDNHSAISEQTIVQCAQFITDAVNFFSSSTTKKIPYEIVYCLNDACQKWINDKTLITTALSPNIMGFYFKPVIKNFYVFFEKNLDVSFDAELIQISLPEIYRRRPLCSTPLYHELGHYIDISRGISELALLYFRKKGNGILPFPDGKNAWGDNEQDIWLNHCREYFADLFSAQFVGRSGIDFLKKLAGSDPSSNTHPSTKNRIEIVENFLSQIKNPVIDMFNDVISALHRGDKLLCSNLSLPLPQKEVGIAFDNVRPFEMIDKSEMHSFIDSSWHYLCRMWDNPTGVWTGLSKETIEKTINDLVEKSIRNIMIIEKWNMYASAE